MILRFLLPRRNLTDRFLKRPPKRDNNGYLWNAWMEIGHPMSSTRNIAQYSGKGTKKQCQSTLISKENFREFHDHHSEKNDKKFEMRIANLRLWTERESWKRYVFYLNTVKLAAVSRWFRPIGMPVQKIKVERVLFWKTYVRFRRWPRNTER